MQRNAASNRSTHGPPGRTFLPERRESAAGGTVPLRSLPPHRTFPDRKGGSHTARRTRRIRWDRSPAPDTRRSRTAGSASRFWPARETQPATGSHDASRHASVFRKRTADHDRMPRLSPDRSAEILQLPAAAPVTVRPSAGEDHPGCAADSHRDRRRPESTGPCTAIRRRASAHRRVRYAPGSIAEVPS